MCEPFNNHCEGIQKFRETGNWKYLCRNELDNLKYDGYQRALASMIYMLFDKKQDWEWV